MPIDPDCPILQERGKGLCWVPSAVWGCTDQELCGKCHLKQQPIIAIPVLEEVVLTGNKCNKCGGQTYKGRLLCSDCRMGWHQKEQRAQQAKIIPHPSSIHIVEPVDSSGLRRCKVCKSLILAESMWDAENNICKNKHCQKQLENIS